MSPEPLPRLQVLLPTRTSVDFSLLHVSFIVSAHTLWEYRQWNFSHCSVNLQIHYSISIDLSTSPFFSTLEAFPVIDQSFIFFILWWLPSLCPFLPVLEWPSFICSFKKYLLAQVIVQVCQLIFVCNIFYVLKKIISTNKSCVILSIASWNSSDPQWNKLFTYVFFKLLFGAFVFFCLFVNTLIHLIPILLHHGMSGYYFDFFYIWSCKFNYT